MDENIVGRVTPRIDLSQTRFILSHSCMAGLGWLDNDDKSDKKLVSKNIFGPKLIYFYNTAELADFERVFPFLLLLS